MTNYFRIFIVLFTLTSLPVAYSQDTINSHHNHERDTFYWITKHPTKHPWLGNSFYSAGAYQFNRTQEFQVDFGRTYSLSFCGGAGCYTTNKSYGLGYSLAMRRNEQHHLLRAFVELTEFYIPPAGVRLEYMYDLTDDTHYIRPSLGISFLWIDLYYNYSIPLNGSNSFGHGVSLRFKFFPGSDNWETREPNRC